MISAAKNDVDPASSNEKNDVLFLWAGTNDLWQNHHSSNSTQNAEATYQNISTYINDRRNAGWDFIIVMTLPVMDDSIKGVDQLNNLIIKNSADADLVINIRDDYRFASNPQRSPWRNSDSVHFTRTGYNYVVDNFYLPVIESINR